jgi:hypothetical protein
MPKYSFCHGWTVDVRKGFSEVTCRRRESCRYYDVDFYRHHGHHLEDFDEMFPFEPCLFFTKKPESVKKEEECKQVDFLAIKD